MTGLEKIIEKINIDCNAECDRILKEAEAQAADILEKAAAEAEIVHKSILQKAKVENKKELELAASKADLDEKKAILAVKIELVNNIIAFAMQKLKNAPDGEYFETVKTLIVRHAKHGNGALCFSQRDISRIPNGFESEVNALLEDRASVTLNMSPADIDSGFILVYGDIEENCSFDALLSASVDRIKDKLYGALFMRDSI